ncbi:MAG: S24 family peptidase [Candidatus Devosia phytovorans]|uniref:S24 family peptidase n=1 Tax=Candidatus Devosia phytovorans TaxID=3121372 RepID=A0AAJ6AZV5_9HYPH|nr:LexA family transcriptional regulator [Devosia sp.]WEK04537.1 MAG: S24 family peptidase [Devosia sp.]
MTEIALIVRTILKKKKWTQARLADELGVTQPTIQRWLGGTMPETENRDALMAMIEDDDHAVARPAPVEAAKTSGDVPNLTIHAGLGSGGLEHVEVDANGQLTDQNYLDGYWTFPDSIRAGISHPSRTHALPVKGDSMEPTLPGGSVVFVDTTHNMPSPPDLYAIDYGDGLMIKRIELVPRSDTVKIISDNERYSNYELQRDELRVYGRVIASFQWRH